MKTKQGIPFRGLGNLKGGEVKTYPVMKWQMIPERFREIAKAIREKPKMYSQEQWGRPSRGGCGCVLSWADDLFGGDEDRDQGGVGKRGAALLGLDPDGPEGKRLFSMVWPTSWASSVGLSLSVPVFVPTAEQAATILEAMAGAKTVWSDPQ